MTELDPATYEASLRAQAVADAARPHAAAVPAVAVPSSDAVAAMR